MKKKPYRKAKKINPKIIRQWVDLVIGILTAIGLLITILNNLGLL